MKKLNIILIAVMLFSITGYAQDLVPYTDKSGNLGYKNNKGKVILKASWSNAEKFRFGVAKVKTNDFYSLINSQGESVSGNFEHIGNFEMGLAIVKLSGKFGLIDIEGKTIIKPEFNAQQLNEQITQYSKNRVAKLTSPLNIKPKESPLVIADSLYFNRKYSDAVEYYDEYLATPNAGYDIYKKMADSYNQMGYHESAAIYFQKALEFKDDPVILYKLAGLYYMHQRYHKSLEMYERALVIHPNNAGMLYSMAKTCSKLGLYERSYQLTLKASKIDPLNFAHFFNLSYYSLFTNRPEKAITAAKRSLELEPKETGAYTNLALGYILNNEYRNAKVIYKVWKTKYFYNVKPIGKEVFLSDIDQLEKMNITHKDFKKAKKLINK